MATPPCSPGARAQAIDINNPDAVIADGLPVQGFHRWRQWSFGPDGKIYYGIGSPGDNEPDPDFTYRAGGESFTFPFGSIIRMDPGARFALPGTMRLLLSATNAA